MMGEPSDVPRSHATYMSHAEQEDTLSHCERASQEAHSEHSDPWTSPFPLPLSRADQPLLREDSGPSYPPVSHSDGASGVWPQSNDAPFSRSLMDDFWAEQQFFDMSFQVGGHWEGLLGSDDLDPLPPSPRASPSSPPPTKRPRLHDPALPAEPAPQPSSASNEDMFNMMIAHQILAFESPAPSATPASPGPFLTSLESMGSPPRDGAREIAAESTRRTASQSPPPSLPYEELPFLADLAQQEASWLLPPEPLDLSLPHHHPELLYRYQTLQVQHHDLAARYESLQHAYRLLLEENRLWLQDFGVSQEKRERPPATPATPKISPQEDGEYQMLTCRVEDTPRPRASPIARHHLAPSALPWSLPLPSMSMPTPAPSPSLRPNPVLLPGHRMPPGARYPPPAPPAPTREYWCSEEGRLFLGQTLERDFRGAEYLYREIGRSIEQGDSLYRNLIVESHPHCKVDETTRCGRIYIIVNNTGKMKFTPSQGSESAGWRANSKSYHAPQYAWEKKRSTFAVHKTPKRACLVVIQRSAPPPPATPTPGPEYFLYHFWIKAV